MTTSTKTKKNEIPKLVGKKELSNMLDTRLFQEIDSQSVHHAGILNLAARFASYVTRLIPQGKSTFLEVTLSQAISDWHCAFTDGDIHEAYTAYCRAIFKSLPSVLHYTVTGKGIPKPHFAYNWDCTSQSIVDWFHLNKINPDEIKVIHHKTPSLIDDRDASFLLATRVFTRQDLIYVGVVDEIHGLRGN